VLLDTPFGFQNNADELVARTPDTPSGPEWRLA
jgi:hypothetical protein